MDAGAHTQVLSGRYELVDQLGRGATAQVWRARDRVLARGVAVKVFDDRAVLDSDTRRAQEMQVLAGLAHPGLVTVFDAGTDGDTTFLVMELIDGPTLSRRLDHGPLGPALVATIGAQLAETLAYVHANRVVHRDVKPANVLLSQRDDGTRAKLADFGVARLLDRTRVTAHGSTVGTANYLSPEQALGHEVGPPSDVYALGLVLIECLSGTPAYPGHGVEAAVARLLRAPRLPDELADDWRTLLCAMTAYAADDRPDAVDVLRSLRAIAMETPVESSGVAVPVAAPVDSTAVLPAAATRRRSRRSGFALAGGVAATVAAVIIASTLSTTAAEPPPGSPSTSSTPSSTEPVAAQSSSRTGSTAATSTPAAVAPVATRSTHAGSTEQTKSRPRTKTVQTKKKIKKGGGPAEHAGPPGAPHGGPGRHKP